jgi:hypothetical protein
MFYNVNIIVSFLTFRLRGSNFQPAGALKIALFSQFSIFHISSYDKKHVGALSRLSFLTVLFLPYRDILLRIPFSNHNDKQYYGLKKGHERAYQSFSPGCISSPLPAKDYSDGLSPLKLDCTIQLVPHIKTLTLKKEVTFFIEILVSQPRNL